MSYGYNQNNGRLETGTTGGNAVSYGYDAMGTLTRVTQAVGGLSNGTQMENTYSYTNDKLTNVEHNGVKYQFSYDMWGNQKTVQVWKQTLVDYGYTNDAYRNVETVTYGNGDKYKYLYNGKGNVTAIQLYFEDEAATAQEYAYGVNGEITSYTDNFNETVTSYSGQDYEVRRMESNALLYSVATSGTQTREQLGSGAGFITTVNESAYDTGTGATTTSAELEVGNGSFLRSGTTDYFGRKSKVSLIRKDANNNILLKAQADYSYTTQAQADGTVRTGTQVSEYNSGIYTAAGNRVNGVEYGYSYDSRGNITEVNTRSATGELNQAYLQYSYDAAGQLVREDNLVTNQTVTYHYDKGGNLTQKKYYPYQAGALGTPNETIDYTYDSVWRDKLASYNNKAITYDAIGNPVSYDGNTYFWYGRQLWDFSNGQGSTSYRYNADGLRTMKLVFEAASGSDYEADRYDYIWSADGLLLGYHYDSGTDDNVVADIRILYGEDNAPMGFSIEDATDYLIYYYVKNQQGDVEKVVNENGETLLEYSYDAWGKMHFQVPADITMENRLLAIPAYLYNPCTYRGYYYDQESGLYYLQSRYYSPEWGRFISADETDMMLVQPEYILSTNLFAYCNNDPVNYTDQTGYAAANIVGGIVGGVIGALLGYIIADALKLSGWKRWVFIGAVTVAGAVLGAIIGPYVVKASKHIISVINSGIRKASRAALKAAKYIKNFKVSAKHLSNARGRYAKFATKSQSQVQSWVSQALKSSKATFHPNGSNSYYIITDMGKAIGTKGERFIKVVFDAAGKIWTAFPVKR